MSILIQNPNIPNGNTVDAQVISDTIDTAIDSQQRAVTAETAAINAAESARLTQEAAEHIVEQGGSVVTTNGVMQAAFETNTKQNVLTSQQMQNIDDVPLKANINTTTSPSANLPIGSYIFVRLYAGASGAIGATTTISIDGQGYRTPASTGTVLNGTWRFRGISDVFGQAWGWVTLCERTE